MIRPLVALVLVVALSTTVLADPTPSPDPGPAPAAVSPATTPAVGGNPVRALSSEQRRGKAKAKLIVGAVLMAYAVLAGAVGLAVAINVPVSSDSSLVPQATYAYASLELSMGLIVGSALLGVGATELKRERAAAPTASLLSVSF